ncbi:hypothetical protein AMATHDRAFT_43779 [Amanita thiersii Skay4041]|uniref:Uncharacterized protein n=1 Tax=Amanita thiersii Skay4041 TaxID=703135 RepID=A0A2A9NEE5_9AGAR|nr:hypothetical protein AMATHDRAFT_43779 [Amanita thiersii Skay4041]
MVSYPVMTLQTGRRNQTAFLKVEAQVIENTLDIRRVLQVPGPQAMTWVNFNKSYTSTIQGLFWIAVSNFVFLVLLAILNLIFMFHDPSFFHEMIMGFVNAYVSIVGVLIATVWAASGRWTEKHSRQPKETTGYRPSVLPIP